MKQEDRQLLLKDLSARLPYGVVLQLTLWEEKNTDCRLTGIDEDGNLTADVPADCAFSVEGVKPYLRPMSSMTEEEKGEYFSFIGGQEPYDCDFSAYPIEYKYIYEWDIKNYINFLNAHHLDYNGLIPKGLAIEVTKENNPYEEINL